MWDFDFPWRTFLVLALLGLIAATAGVIFILWWAAMHVRIVW